MREPREIIYTKLKYVRAVLNLSGEGFYRDLIGKKILQSSEITKALTGVHAGLLRPIG